MIEPLKMKVDFVGINSNLDSYSRDRFHSSIVSIDLCNFFLVSQYFCIVYFLD